MYKCLARRTGPQPSHMDASRLDVGKGAGSDWVRNGGTVRGESRVPGCRILNRVRGSLGTQDKQDENVILFCSLKARDWLLLGPLSFGASRNFLSLKLPVCWWIELLSDLQITQTPAEDPRPPAALSQRRFSGLSSPDKECTRWTSNEPALEISHSKILFK